MYCRDCQMGTAAAYGPTGAEIPENSRGTACDIETISQQFLRPATSALPNPPYRTENRAYKIQICAKRTCLIHL